MLQKSADMEYFISSLKIGINIFVFSVVFIAFLYLVILHTLLDVKYLLYIFIFFILVFCLPFLLYILFFMIRIWLLLKNKDRYKLLEVDLVNVQRETWITNNCYFEFVLKNKDGEAKMCKTKPIFSLSKYMKPRLDDYINTHALIAYDENKKRIVLLKPLYPI